MLFLPIKRKRKSFLAGKKLCSKKLLQTGVTLPVLDTAVDLRQNIDPLSRYESFHDHVCVRHPYHRPRSNHLVADEMTSSPVLDFRSPKVIGWTHPSVLVDFELANLPGARSAGSNTDEASK